MKTRTNQEIFDISATHLLKQGQRSIKKNKCMYRHPSGRKCAVGILIPDELYKPAMDSGWPFASVLMQEHPDLRPYLGGAKSEILVRRLQSIHDVNVPENWRILLRELATDFKLKKTVLMTKER